MSVASTLGLGLLFSYNKMLIISGLGFSLFINAYSLQYYPLISVLWAKAQIFNLEAADTQMLHPFYLSSDLYISQANVLVPANLNFNHIEGCFRAALAINVAISCVLGRVGLF